ncbi:Orthopedia [Operophtera brumata]|uniref:Orthopedia n=1 Tax=Operophtera brumata TaxID=104452 RepID=A0A0L7KUF1_OPEBR|nr:Orthopedia [Operophtera brumata]
MLLVPLAKRYLKNRRAKWKKRKKSTNVFRSPGALLPSHGLPPFGGDVCSSGVFGDRPWSMPAEEEVWRGHSIAALRRRASELSAAIPPYLQLNYDAHSPVY